MFRLSVSLVCFECDGTVLVLTDCKVTKLLSPDGLSTGSGSVSYSTAVNTLGKSVSSMCSTLLFLSLVTAPRKVFEPLGKWRLSVKLVVVVGAVRFLAVLTVLAFFDFDEIWGGEGYNIRF